MLRRLALRSAVRRPREGALVVAGSMLGAAIITGSMIVGDTMDASLRQAAYTHLGPVDELVSVQGAGEQRRLLQALGAEGGEIDGALGLATIDAAATSTGLHMLAVPHSQVIGIDFERARSFGGDPAATGVLGPNPSVGHAAVGRDLARALDLEPGSRMSVHAYGTQISLVVDRVLPRRGLAGFWLGPEQEANNVLVSPRTFDVIRATGGETAPPAWSVAVSNRGGVEDGVAATDAATRQVQRAAARAGVGAEVYPVKLRTLEAADALGEGFTSMFTAMGSFGILAGLLLLVNLFVMLAAERKTGARHGPRCRPPAPGARRRIRHRGLALRDRRDHPRRRHRDRPGGDPGRRLGPNLRLRAPTLRSLLHARAEQPRRRSRSASSSRWRRSSARASA